MVTVLTGVLALWVNLRFLRLDMDTAGNYNVGLLALYFLGRLTSLETPLPYCERLRRASIPNPNGCHIWAT